MPIPMEIRIPSADLTSGLMNDVTFAHNDLEKAPRKGKVCVLEMTHQGGGSNWRLAML